MPLTPLAFTKALLDQNEFIHLSLVGRTKATPSWGIGPRKVQDYLLQYVASGAVEAEIDGEQVCIATGDFLWVQPGTSHTLSLATQTPHADIYYIRFHFESAQRLALGQTFIRCQAPPSVIQTWEHLFHLHEMSPEFRDLRMRCSLSEICIHFFDALRRENKEGKGLNRTQRSIVINFIHTRIASRFTVADIAHELGLNPHYFTRRFSDSFEMSLQQYIKQTRIQKACGMLSEEGLSISEVAYALGYQDVYFFSRQFKSVMSLSPRFWISKNHTN